MNQYPSVNLINKTGFTLIEFCVAVLIMMVGLLGLLQAVNIAIEHNYGSLLRNEAISLADDQMIATKISVISVPTFTDLAAQSNNYLQKKTRAGFYNYSVVRTSRASRTVTHPVTGVITATSQEVSVRVSWRYKGRKNSHTITTMISNPDPAL